MHSAVASVISSVRKKIHLKKLFLHLFLDLEIRFFNWNVLDVKWQFHWEVLAHFWSQFYFREREKKVMALKWLKTIPNFRLAGVWGWRELVPRCDFCPWWHFIYCPLFLIVIKTFIFKLNFLYVRSLLNRFTHLSWISFIIYTLLHLNKLFLQALKRLRNHWSPIFGQFWSGFGLIKVMLNHYFSSPKSFLITLFKLNLSIVQTL